MLSGIRIRYGRKVWGVSGTRVSRGDLALTKILILTSSITAAANASKKHYTPCVIFLCDQRVRFELSQVDSGIAT